MLKVFRDNLKNLAWILWVIIALFVLALAADFGSRTSGTRGNEAAVARVGGESISRQEFQRAYQNMTNVYRQIYGDQLSPDIEKQMYRQTLTQTVVQKIQTLEARRLGLSVSDAELRDQILSFPTFKDAQGHFVGEATYSQVIQEGLHTTVADFEKELRDQLLVKKLTDALSANLYVSEDEIQRAYRDQVERAKIRYVELPRNRFAQQVNVTPAEVASYYQAHKQDFKLPEQRDLAYVLVNSTSASPLASQAQVSDAELRSYYDAHKADYSQEEQIRARHILIAVNDQRADAAASARAQEVLKKLTAGGDFAKLAQEYSDDAASKVQGGDLGLFGRNRMVKEFEDAAFNAPVGKVVGPVKSNFGYHLIEVTAKQPGGQQPFEAVKEQIRARLTVDRTRQLAESRAKDLATRLASQKPANADALKALAAQNPGTTFGEAKVGTVDPIPGLGASLNATGFSLKKGEVSPALQVPQGWAIVYVNDIIAPHAPELKEVEDRVRASLTNQKLQQITLQKLEDARKEIAQGKTLDQVAAELGVQAKETQQEFGGQGGMIPGLGYNPELVKTALTLQAGQVGGPLADAQGGVLFQVTDRKGWDPKQYAANRDQTRTKLLQQRVGSVEGALIEKRRRDLNVTFDQQFLDQLGIAPPSEG
ncbi:MAG TPA: peptidyl-prolyl cis-trans isomerase [Thermoanaerobaculia bacterium]|jgi:peptidyl-prolyl cis-trans isomerase D|nr:peptidyl-prolyl cis-trans isomerase [Thermoanaerobaculia bacterium]